MPTLASRSRTVAAAGWSSDSRAAATAASRMYVVGVIFRRPAARSMSAASPLVVRRPNCRLRRRLSSMPGSSGGRTSVLTGPLASYQGDNDRGAAD